MPQPEVAPEKVEEVVHEDNDWGKFEILSS